MPSNAAEFNGATGEPRAVFRPIRREQRQKRSDVALFVTHFTIDASSQADNCFEYWNGCSVFLELVE
ncbi:hypothetical protein [Rhodovulum visakhapatnamense]|uniref:hypothetical protein n=1 Tax=Rhodovulum visakhapatnamense TaxID=364297 RepID=UPI00106565E1|nr:hypothetical protein [Rhodovulum visakhapatnamense]